MKCYCEECAFNLDKQCFNLEAIIFITSEGTCSECALVDDHYDEAEPLKEGEKNEE